MFFAFFPIILFLLWTGVTPDSLTSDFKFSLNHTSVHFKYCNGLARSNKTTGQCQSVEECHDCHVFIPKENLSINCSSLLAGMACFVGTCPVVYGAIPGGQGVMCYTLFDKDCFGCLVFYQPEMVLNETFLGMSSSVTTSYLFDINRLYHYLLRRFGF